MRRLRHVGAVVALGIALTPGSAAACRTFEGFVLSDVLLADVVVTGTIYGYAIRSTSGETSDPAGVVSDYARFGIRVDQVLAGTVPPEITVTWDNSTFGEPTHLDTDRTYLIALRRAEAHVPPLRGFSATILPTPEPDLLTVLQAPCAGPFLMLADSQASLAIHQILDGEGDAAREAAVLQESLTGRGQSDPWTWLASEAVEPN